MVKTVSSLHVVRLALILSAGTVLGLAVYGGRSGHITDPPLTAKQKDALAVVAPKPASQPAPPIYFPNGGTQLLPQYRLIAIYGTPGDAVLGALGAQSLPDTLTRVKAMAASYQPLFPEAALPTLEIITTVASASPTDNKDYSREIEISTLQPWIDAARAAGVYTVLDLQPGRTDFLTQAKQYESLLKQPFVGLALDPEWRLAPNQKPLAQIGQVSIEEVNSVADWLSTLTRQNRLPQKLFLLHEFNLTMINHRELLNTSHPELAYIIQMDGQGAPPVKHDTWVAIMAGAPSGVRFGWKNFYAKDQPMLTPQQTMAITPMPWYVSYQ